MIVKLLVLALLILINAFFAMSEIAIISLNDNKIKKLAEDGHKRAAKIVKLTKDSSGFLATIQVGVTLAGFLSSASAAQSFTHLLSGSLQKLFTTASPSLVNTISTVLITVVLSYFSLVFGELVPKKIAMQKPEQISFAIVGFLLFVRKIFAPFVKLLSFSTNLVVKLFGINPESFERTVTEEEILMMVDVGGEKGVIEKAEKEMIENIFEFGDTTASEIMTHRTEMQAIENTASISELVELSIEEGYSRIPVFEEDLDTILGIIYVKDLLGYVVTDLPSNLQITDFMRPAYFVPECKKLGELFKEMGEQKISLAIVVDEYGGTSGLVTMEDILESIVGNIQDEFDNEEDEISMVSDNCFTVDGTTSVDEVSDLIGTELPEGDYDTIAGYIVSVLGRIPSQDEHPSISFQNITFTVEIVEERRIAKVLIVRNPIDDKPTFEVE
ncbi:MAG: HlyC/CorC family transporter [Clostridia bacterium]|nr:HlyC/CorC family transporter [Clostridia bacterium]